MWELSLIIQSPSGSWIVIQIVTPSFILFLTAIVCHWLVLNPIPGARRHRQLQLTAVQAA